MGANDNQYKMFGIFNRKFKMTVAEPPKDMKEAFSLYADGVKEMTPDQLHRFLVERQGEDWRTVEDAKEIMRKVFEMRKQSVEGDLRFTLDDFFFFLFQDELNASIKSQVHHDLTAPLSHYLIYTSHNSYLTGNQLSSDSSDVPIINALHRGVRVIELDIWPNDTNDDIQVLHGRTLTTPIALIKCLRSIKEHAFVASEYPMVITLEDHLTPDLQAKVAEMIHQTFGDILFTPGSECVREFPSPESLKRKIMISTKPPKEYMKGKELKESDCKRSKNATAWGRGPKSFKQKVDDDKDDVSTEDNDDDDDDDDDDDGEDSKAEQDAAPEYKSLISIQQKKKQGELADLLRVDPNEAKRLSLSEPQLEKAIKTHAKDIIRFTQKNIMRIYPKGIRFDSSNYNPLIGWAHGAQMVAFNMQGLKSSVELGNTLTQQGYGKSLWLMQGMFKANGGCGYVKKPDFLLRADAYAEVFNPSLTLPAKTTLRVTVYMGEGWYSDFDHAHFDSYSPPEFYARVGIAGVPTDTSMKKTKKVKDNWIPTWDEVFEFPLTVPELALLRIEVHEHDTSEKDDFGGQTCLPVSELRSGIRAVPLQSENGEKYNSVRLLMRFEFT